MNKAVTIGKVVRGGYCVGCGGCASRKSGVTMRINDIGMPEPVHPRLDGIAADSCPFGDAPDETRLANALFAGIPGIEHHPSTGFHSSLYAGHAVVGPHRAAGSSGGLTSWVLEELLTRGEVDAVIHVGRGPGDGIFEYLISNSVEEMRPRVKSLYYPTGFHDVLEQVRREQGRTFAITGVPCHIKALRLVVESDPLLRGKIKFFIGIFCGHMKSRGFVESFGWQLGIEPDQVTDVDFRVKDETRPANDYSIQVSSATRVERTENFRLYGSDWGLGLFKPLACDFCDDVACETADVVMGDAWLPEYVKDSLGTNVVIVRHPLIARLLSEARDRGDIALDPIEPAKIHQSQAATFRHRGEGLQVRLAHMDARGIWRPSKRVQPGDAGLPRLRQRLYITRMRLSQASHRALRDAKKRGGLAWYFLRLLPYDVLYNYQNRQLLRRTYRTLRAMLQSLVLRPLGRKP
ncbi:Coenzyme F420 hydrogenase/dehydrogenase, beta subunit C-terminal domain [Stenotrophomonas geniculata]|uniref:Coenzyme F420 hydrogenase/dehydrogenase, beta subunit C-terminal domain n=1 Tax=Stenotrophomonas geniculata TaxID=86188 RepID=UPI002E79128A|nr:Coenzyme F420 hydrogenase/dehydrogenase, beta subunit C-terminal domain [Stenotrophomonas geniculata]